MMSPERTDAHSILSGAPYNIAGVWGAMDYPIVMMLCRKAAEAVRTFDGMQDLCMDTCMQAGIGMGGT